jgi:hypothetical protein
MPAGTADVVQARPTTRCRSSREKSAVGIDSARDDRVDGGANGAFCVAA